jgi:hypothetical protein
VGCAERSADLESDEAIRAAAYSKREEDRRNRLAAKRNRTVRVSARCCGTLRGARVTHRSLVRREGAADSPELWRSDAECDGGFAAR